MTVGSGDLHFAVACFAAFAFLALVALHFADLRSAFIAHATLMLVPQSSHMIS
jgi:hypothetical protein